MYTVICHGRLQKRRPAQRGGRQATEEEEEEARSQEDRDVCFILITYHAY
jgi:hypothetical protein